jgi:hypothetical protein
MRMPVTAVFVFVSVLAGSLTCGLAWAQQGVTGSMLVTPPNPLRELPQTPPPRDPRAQAQAPRVGTGALRGRVIDGQTGQPLVHARVRLSGLSGPQPPSTSTDTTGIFEFGKLPAGRYSLWAYKGGYNQASYPEMAPTLRSLGSPIVLTEGQTVDNIRLAMYHGAAIVGHVVDSYGDPIDNVNVQVIAAPGYGQVRSFSSAMANDAGEFRLGRLQAGAYLVVATSNGGRPFGETEPTTPAPTYYPGVLSPDQAQVVMVERGQVVGGIDFQMIDQPVSVVTGLVTDSTGAPAVNGNVHATSLATAVNAWNTGNQIHPDGSFELKLPPGSYRIEAWAAPRREPSASGATSGVMGGVVRGVGSGDDNQQQQGFATINVSGEAVTNVVIATGSGGTITGRLVFDGDGAPPDLARISVMATGQRNVQTFFGGMRGGNECRAKPGKVNPDLTFTIDGVYGTCLLNLSIGGGMGRWLVRSAMYRDVDLLDRPVEITNQQHVRDVPIVMTTKRGSLSADVTDDQGSPTEDYVLLAFSTDKNRWLLPRYLGTAVRSNASQNQGQPPTGLVAGTAQLDNPSFLSRQRGVINWLPPGDYYVVALDDVGVEDMRDPAYLEQLVGRATRTTVRENEAQALPLHRLKAPPSTTQRTPR